MLNTPILIVSCDKYSDIWEPFFGIFWKRWPDCPYSVYLGSNCKIYSDERVRTIAVGNITSWTYGVLKMLEQFNTDHIILCLEDFFIQCPVDTSAIERLVSIAKEKHIGCLRFAPSASLPYSALHPLVDFPDLTAVPKGESYRVSTQMAIWDIRTLKNLLIPGCSIWDFELLGTQLSEFTPDIFWCSRKPAIVYDHGLEKGKWKPEGIAICKEAGVQIDLTSRPVFTKEELETHYMITKGSPHYNIKHNAIVNFRLNCRKEGLQYGLRYLHNNPFSIQLWLIIFFGLLGSSPIIWLQKQYLRLKIIGFIIKHHLSQLRFFLL